MKEIKGNLIDLAKKGKFDVIVHGCNCMCVQGAGIAKSMNKTFQTNNPDFYHFEHKDCRGMIDKLGSIDYALHDIADDNDVLSRSDFTLGSLSSFKERKLIYDHSLLDLKTLFVVNAYTQFEPGRNNLYPGNPPLDYNALAMCLTKMNFLFKGLHIGLPWIGCGLAKGNKIRVKFMIEEFLCDCKVTIVEYEKD